MTHVVSKSTSWDQQRLLTKIQHTNKQNSFWTNKKKNTFPNVYFKIKFVTMTIIYQKI